MYHGKRLVVTLALSLFMLVAVYSNVHADPPQVIFEEDFESGWGTWWADYGVWEIGVPTAGPAAAHGGANCAATVLGGDYPGYTDSRMIGPAVTLPAVTGDEEIHLCFWHWFSYAGCENGYCDYGFVQVSVQDPATGDWSAWENVSEKIQDSTPVWSRTCVDLTPYASQNIKIAFFHSADRYSGHSTESTGWYIDDVEIIRLIPQFSGTFELGWGDWYGDRGVWEIGVPTAGPAAAHGGANCAATVLGGDYPGYTDSRMIGPAVTLPAVTGDEEIHLCFWHWFSYAGCENGYCDYGFVQVSVQDPATGDWSAWENVSEKIQDSTPVWSRTCVDLTPYASQNIKIAFFHSADRYSGHSTESTGWYIDDVEITGITQPPLPDIKAKGKDWGVFVGPGKSVEITVALDPTQMAGTPCDWWIGAFTPFGTYWLNPNRQWVPSSTPVRVGAFGLLQLSDTSVLDMGLPLGFYTFFFILDNNPNGTLDRLSWYDYVNVVCGADGDGLSGLEDADKAFLERLEYLMD